MKKFNNWLAMVITSAVSTMTCAYVFAGLAGYGATGVDWHNPFQIVSWVSQTFLQLVLLSIIMVGQRVINEASDKQAKEMHDAVLDELSEIKAIHKDIQQLLSK